jgi:3,4-dihydroxy 2-butanone 4-phosphate synthase/GTP cyclohydrolase II
VSCAFSKVRRFTNKQQIHIALTKGTWNLGESIFNQNQFFASKQWFIRYTLNPTNVDQQLDDMFRVINEKEKALDFINQDAISKFIESNSWTQIITKWRSYEGTKIIIDSKDFGIGAQIRMILIFQKIRLVSNTEGTKRVGMIDMG